MVTSTCWVRRGIPAATSRAVSANAVVLQSDYLAELSTWLVAPTSTSALPLSFRPRIEVEGQPTLLLVDQLAAADVTRLGRPAGRLTRDELAEADAALRIVHGLR